MQLRFVFSALSVVSVLTLAACGSSTPTPPPDGERPAGATTPATAPGGERPASATPSAYQAADASSPDVKAAAEFAIGEQARRSGRTLTLGAIKKAEQQAVGPITNYHLCLDFDQDGGSEDATAVVMRSAEKQLTLTSWNQAPCGE